jgi:hypothetical protein
MALNQVDGTRALEPDHHKRLLKKEAELARRYGDPSDRKALKRAIHAAMQIEAADWCRSSDALANYLDASHDSYCAKYVHGSAWNLRQRVRNVAARRRADRAVLSVTVVLVDIVDSAYLTESYRLAHALAVGNQ